MIEIINRREEWNRLIESCNIADFYHTFEYHSLDKKDGEEAILIHYRDNKLSVLLPLILRNIEGTEFLDATSVYGYSGPLFKGELNQSSIDNFQNALSELFRSLNVVSVFTRLHPFLNRQVTLLNGLGRVESLGRVVSIDLKISEEQQWHGISKRFRTYINKGRRRYTVRKAEGPEDLKIFNSLYEQTMHRLKAKSHYFFGYEHFKVLYESQDYDTQILLAEERESGKVVSGAMFISYREFVQYHLSGTDEDYLHMHPIRILIDEMRLIANKAGKHYFNLGGGLGGAEDSLFEFKSRFSKDFREFKVWKYVCNRRVYNELSERHIKPECPILNNECCHYFPCYRCPVHNKLNS